MSSDESDPESPGDYRRVYPSWRGTQLEMQIDQTPYDFEHGESDFDDEWPREHDGLEQSD